MNILTAKKIGLGVAGALAALFLGKLFAVFLGQPSGSNLIWTLIASAIFLSIFLLQVILVSDKILIPIFIALQVLAIGVFLFDDFSLMLLLGMAIAFSALMLAAYFGAAEVRNNLEIHFPKISRIIMAYSTIAVALFASFAYTGSFHINDALETKRNLEVMIGPMEPLIGRYVPGFSSRHTIREIAGAILPSEFQLATPAQKAEAISQISVRLAESFSGFAGVPVAVSDRVIDIIYKATIGKILNYSALTQSFFLIGFGLLFFFFIKFLFLFVDWSAVFIGYVFFRLLKALHFFRIDTQEVSKRVIMLI